MAAAKAKRTPSAIKADVENEGRLTRQDVYEILKNQPGKTIKEKKKGVSDFIETLPSSIVGKKDGFGKTIQEKVMSDLESYPLI